LLDDAGTYAPAGVGAQVERLLYLKKLPILGGLPQAQLLAVAEQMRERIYTKGDVLVQEGRPVEGIKFVVQGKVHVSRQGRPAGHAGPGTGVGGYWVLSGRPASMEVTAETDVLTLEVPAETVMELLEEHFALLLLLLRDTSAQIIALVLRRGWYRPGPRETEEEPPPWQAPDRELDLVERIFFMRQSPPFRQASINALAELSRGFSEVRHEAGTTIWKEGEPAGWVALVVSGRVLCSPSRGTPFEVSDGSPVGALEAVAAVPRWYDAVALTPVRALHGNIQWLLDVFEDNFEMARDYLALFSYWLQDGMERAVEGQDLEILKIYGLQDAEAHEG
jgi:CRP-like cAMP-binding protein